MTDDKQKIRTYSKYFSENAFWDKLSRTASTAGRRVIESALVLYYCLRDGRTPAKARTLILGALGYLILPLDAIPDFIPGVGFTDDLTALVAVLSMLSAYVRPEHRTQAKRRVQEWFPEVRTGKPPGADSAARD